jgi:hypothetical protein
LREEQEEQVQQQGGDGSHVPAAQTASDAPPLGIFSFFLEVGEDSMELLAPDQFKLACCCSS